MLNEEQTQSVKENSLAIQAKGDVIITTGISATEAREIAMLVARNVFFELSSQAKEIAQNRVNEITDQVIEKLKERNPTGFQKAIDPGFQYSLFHVQKEYARSGDKELGELLVNLLVESSKEEPRSLLQIVLDESIQTAPKLTASQLAMVSVAHILLYIVSNEVSTLEALGQFLDKYLEPNISNLFPTRISQAHLEYTGCISVGLTPFPRVSVLISNAYPGLFSKGFDQSNVTEGIVQRAQNLQVGAKSFTPFIKCVNDSSKLQVAFLNERILENHTQFHNVPEDDRQTLKNLLKSNLMTPDEAEQALVHLRPYISNLVSALKMCTSFELTSVGMVLAHANLVRIGGQMNNLKDWVR